MDLGREPWAFRLVEAPAREDFAAGRTAVAGGPADGRTHALDLGAVHRVEAVRVVVAGAAVKEVRFAVHHGVTEGAWTTIPARMVKAEPVIEKKVTDTAGTVGFVDRVVGGTFERSAGVEARFLRVEFEKWQGAPEVVRIEAFGPHPRIEDDLALAEPGADDSGWERVGIPHCWNDLDTYLNGRETPILRATGWYRRHLPLAGETRGRRFHLLFEGANVGAAVYVNGRFQPGVTAVPQPGDVTHVGGFIPFTVDVTDSLRPGDNVIAVRVGNAEHGFFTWPGFGVFEEFCMGWGGLVGPVRLVATDEVHIPLDVHGPGGRWGGYIATVAATRERAEIRHRTQVANDGEDAVAATLETRVLDPAGAAVLEVSATRDVPAGAVAVIEGGGTIDRPELWFPNASPHGQPALYRIVQRVIVDGRETDRVERAAGLRVITWDADFCYVNGEKTILNGFGHRNAYPALGSAVPAALQWGDMRLLAAAGGNALRVGHVPPPSPTLEACDELGILVIADSGDNEWSLYGAPADAYKPEYDRDMIVAFRNHPAVAVWEANNGVAKEGAIIWPGTTKAVVDAWDDLAPRIVLTRDSYPKAGWNPGDRIVVGYTNAYAKVPGSPSLNTEVYGARWDGLPSHNAARFDWEHEKELAAWFVDDYLKDLEGSACGWIHWMLAETQGEGYTIYLNGMRNQRSLGSSALDGNRFPRLLYRIFERALWVPFPLRPGVALQSHWNLSGVQEVDAWSNCPAVELALNGRSLGVRAPDPRSRRCTWGEVGWEPGTIAATGLDAAGAPVCRDERVTAGDPRRLRVEFEPAAAGPDGSPFPLRANGTDAAIATVTVVDAAGVWCPLADHAIRFSLNGPATWRGSYNFYADPAHGLRWHSPGDRELAAEGGVMRVAVRTGFIPGAITIRAAADGLEPGAATVVSAG
ncbi:MAG: DUF4982 domain-containing protein [Candidatus Coatesbacteria bacterium]